MNAKVQAQGIPVSDIVPPKSGLGPTSHTTVPHVPMHKRAMTGAAPAEVCNRVLCAPLVHLIPFLAGRWPWRGRGNGAGNAGGVAADRTPLLCDDAAQLLPDLVCYLWSPCLQVSGLSVCQHYEVTGWIAQSEGSSQCCMQSSRAGQARPILRSCTFPMYRH